MDINESKIFNAQTLILAKIDKLNKRLSECKSNFFDMSSEKIDKIKSIQESIRDLQDILLTL